MKNFIVLFASLVLISCSNSNNNDKSFKETDTDSPSDLIVELSNLQDGDLFVAVESELDFGTTTSSAKTLNKKVGIKNNSSTSMAISFDSLSSNGFSIKLNRCSSNLAAGKSCEVTLGFSGRSLYDGIATDNFIVHGGTNQVSVSLKATVSEQPNNQTLPPSLSFTLDAASPTSELRILNVHNAGPGDANNLVVSAPAGYAIWTNRCPSTLKSNKKCSVNLLYKNYRVSPPVEATVSVAASGGAQNAPLAPISVSVITGQNTSSPVEIPMGLSLTKDLSTGSSQISGCVVSPSFPGSMDQFSCSNAASSLMMCPPWMGMCPPQMTASFSNNVCVLNYMMNPNDQVSQMDCMMASSVLNNGGMYQASSGTIEITAETSVKFIGAKNGKSLSVKSSNGKFIVSDGSETGTKELSVMPNFDPNNFTISVIGVSDQGDLYFVHTDFIGGGVFNVWKSDLTNSVTLIGALPISQIGHSTFHNNTPVILGQRLSDGKTGFYHIQNGTIIPIFPNLIIDDYSNVKVLSLKLGLVLLLTDFSHPGLEGGIYTVNNAENALLPVMGTDTISGLPAHLTIDYPYNIGYELGKEQNVPLNGTVISDGILYMFDSKVITGPAPTYTHSYINHVITCDGQTGYIRELSPSFGEITYAEPMVDNEGFVYVSMLAGDTGLYVLDRQLSSFTKIINDPNIYNVRMFRIGSKLFSFHFDLNLFSVNVRTLSNGQSGLSVVATISGAHSNTKVIGNSVLFSNGTVMNGNDYSLSNVSDVPEISAINDLWGALNNYEPNNVSSIKASSSTYFINGNFGSAGKEIYVLKFPY